MNTATRTIKLTIPESDICTAERISRGMGWKLFILDDAENDEERRRDAEEFARKLCVNEEDFEEMKAHDFYMHEKPEFQTFASEEEELAYYDSLTEDDFLSEEESAKIIERWKNL